MIINFIIIEIESKIWKAITKYNWTSEQEFQNQGHSEK